MEENWSKIYKEISDSKSKMDEIFFMKSANKAPSYGLGSLSRCEKKKQREKRKRGEKSETRGSKERPFHSHLPFALISSYLHPLFHLCKISPSHHHPPPLLEEPDSEIFVNSVLGCLLLVSSEGRKGQERKKTQEKGGEAPFNILLLFCQNLHLLWTSIPLTASFQSMT